MRISDWSSDVCSSDLIVAEGRTLKLSDVAEITRGYEDPATFLVRHQGEPALELGVVMKDRYNGLQLGEDLDREAAAITADLPPGLSFTKITDQSDTIEEANSRVMINYIVEQAGALLVCQFGKTTIREREDKNVQ